MRALYQHEISYLSKLTLYYIMCIKLNNYICMCMCMALCIQGEKSPGHRAIAMGVYPIHNLKSQVCKNEDVSPEESSRIAATLLTFC